MMMNENASLCNVANEITERAKFPLSIYVSQDLFLCQGFFFFNVTYIGNSKKKATGWISSNIANKHSEI